MVLNKVACLLKQNGALISLILATIALIISIKSCNEATVATEISRKAYNLSLQQHNENRLLVLTGKFNEKEEEFFILPIDSSLSLQQSKAKYIILMS